MQPRQWWSINKSKLLACLLTQDWFSSCKTQYCCVLKSFRAWKEENLKVKGKTLAFKEHPMSDDLVMWTPGASRARLTHSQNPLLSCLEAIAGGFMVNKCLQCIYYENHSQLSWVTATKNDPSLARHGTAPLSTTSMSWLWKHFCHQHPPMHMYPIIIILSQAAAKKMFAPRII